MDITLLLLFVLFIFLFVHFVGQLAYGWYIKSGPYDPKKKKKKKKKKKRNVK